LKELQQQLEEAKEQLQESKEQLEEQKSKSNNGDSADVEEVQSELNKVKEKYKQAQDELKSMKSAMKSDDKKSSKDSNKEVEGLQKQRRELQSEIDTLKEELDTSKKEAKEATEELTQSKNEIKEANAKVAKAEEEAATLRREIERLRLSTPSSPTMSRSTSVTPSKSYTSLVGSVSKRDVPSDKPEVPIQRLNSVQLLDLINSLDEYEDAERERAKTPKGERSSNIMTVSQSVDELAQLLAEDANPPTPKTPVEDKVVEKKKSSGSSSRSKRVTMAVSSDMKAELDKMHRDESRRSPGAKREKSSRAVDDDGIRRQNSGANSSPSGRKHGTKK